MKFFVSFKAHHHNMLEFSLPTNDILLSKIFSYLDNAKATLNLQDYTISQTTLDQVFVNFASQENRDSLDNRKINLNTVLQQQQSTQNHQLPYLNDLKSRISSRTNEKQVNENRFEKTMNNQKRSINLRLNDLNEETRIDGLSNNELRNSELKNNDEFIQKRPSNLMKSSSVYSFHQFNSQMKQTNQTMINKNQLKNSKSNNNQKYQTVNCTPKQSTNNKKISKNLNSINHLNDLSTLHLFNPSTQMKNLKNIKNLNQSITTGYPPTSSNKSATRLTVSNGNYLTQNNVSNNIFCPIIIPTTTTSNHLYNTVQPLIILPDCVSNLSKSKRKK